MNFLTRAKLSATNRLCALRTIMALQQLNFYSAKTFDSIPKTVQLTRPKTRKSSGSSSFYQRSKRQTGALTVWPKPAAVPYQAKHANFVNLIGYVKTPVRFETAADGKHFTAVLISSENSCKSNSSLIPVLFEGDLAHIVAHHLKENDFVFVSGQLSAEPLGFAFSEGFGGLHIMAENVNYVEGADENVSGNNVGVKVDKPGFEKLEEVRKLLENKDVRLIVQHLMDQMKSLLGAKNDVGLGVSKECSGVQEMQNDTDVVTAEVVEAKVEKGDEKSAESVKETKDGDKFWRDVAINPWKWWDYRPHKATGLVKEKFPDFRHKETGQGLWVNRAPTWVLPGLKKLEFDVKVIKPNTVQGGGGTDGAQGGGWTGGKKNESKGEDSWKHLVENPYKWWDNRFVKRSLKAPDFKHKETGEGLWLTSAPGWVLSKLPQLKDSKNAFDSEKNQQTL